MTENATSFQGKTTAPTARLVSFGLVALLVCAAISYYQHDRGILIGGSLAIPIVIALVLWLYRAGRSAFASHHARLLIYIYLLAQAALLIWNLLQRR